MCSSGKLGVAARLGLFERKGGFATTMTTVGILGITHDPVLQERCHLPLTRVRSLIEAFRPDVICGEVEPRSWRLYQQTGDARGILGETPTEYPALIYPFCAERGIEFVPVDWFLEDVFQEGIFDRFEPARRTELERELERWQEWQLGTLDVGGLPLNSDAYDAVTRGLYAWLAQVNPGVQAVVWEARHAIMLGRVRAAIRRHPGRRVLCIHGADHNYAYRHALGARSDLRVVFPLA